MELADILKIIAIVIVVLGALATYAVMAVTCWWMKHNVPQLWHEIDVVKGMIHEINNKVTKEIAVRNDRREWKVRDPKGGQS
jgi:uncharacterized membrane protein required for colicin V production